MKETSKEQSDGELLEFIKHIKKDSDMQGLSLSEQEELKERIDRKNKYYDQRFRRLWIWSGSVAASICLLFSGWYAFSHFQTKTFDYAGVMQKFESGTEAAENVQLLLSKDKKIAIEGKETQVDYSKEGCVDINKKEKVEVKKEDKDEKTIFNQLVVPAGKRSMLTLNDGTKVWINSGSKLVFPVNFEKNKREIFAEGEIYLDVTHDPDRPFIVHTQSIDMKVLGTQFNVSAYTDEPNLQVVLVSGKVEIRENGNSKEILKPNQMFSYNKENHDFSTSPVNVTDYTAWKDGYYIFNSKNLGIVFTKLSKYYNVHFKCDEKINELICSGKLDLKDNLQEVLSLLEKAAPTIKIQNTSESEYTVIVKP